MIPDPSSLRTRAARLLTHASALAALLSGCGGGGSAEPPPTEEPVRSWSFSVYPRDGTDQVGTGDRGSEVRGGVLDKRHDFGPQVLRVESSLGDKLRAEGEVFANATGKTYWAWAEAPQTTEHAGAISDFTQRQGYVKLEANASLEMVISSAFIEAIDGNAEDIFLSRACPWLADLGRDACEQTMSGDLLMNIVVVPTDSTDLRVNYGEFLGEVKLKGWARNWRSEVPVVTRLRSDPARPSWSQATELVTRIWSEADFEFDPDASGSSTRANARVRLRQPRTVKVNLSSVPIGKEFVVLVYVRARVLNRRGGESYMAAYLRDPASSSGVGEITHVTSGLQPSNRDFTPPPASAPVPAPPCPAPNPAAGTLQFSAASYRMPEWAGADSPIVVTRTGGSSGKVSVTFRTSDGTALAGADYEPASGSVTFGDGDTEPRVIDIGIVHDTVAEPDKSIQLALSAPTGCATLGAQASAELVILDDDRPLTPPPTFTLGGTITGLAGSGLVLDETSAFTELSPSANGAFAFNYRFLDGAHYNVRIKAQPTAPDQVCSVSRGSGTVTAANVADIAIDCVTPAAHGALDPTFGSGGKLYVGDIDAARAIVVQRTGRVVVLASRLGVPLLARFDALGAPDPTFGSGGRVEVRFNGGLDEEAYGLAVQPDDKLIVVGRAKVPDVGGIIRFDMAVARYNADGSLDTAFGNRGLTTINPYVDLLPSAGVAKAHYAHRALVAADGKIVVAGVASWRKATGGADPVNFAVAQLNADGTPDTTFAGGHGGTANMETPARLPRDGLAYALGVQSDGKVVLAGAANNQLGLARFKTSGKLDSDDPRTTDNYARDGSGIVVFDDSNTGRDLVMLADDTLVVAATHSVAHPQLGSVTKIRLVHVSSSGTLITDTDTPMGPDNDSAGQLLRQADGKFVLAATVSSGTVSDLGVLRYNADLSLDTGFGLGGAVLVDFFGARDGALAVAIDRATGAIYATGMARNGTIDGLGIVKINP